MNGTLTMPRSYPVKVPTVLQEKINVLSTIKYRAITFDSTSSTDEAYDTSYGTEGLPAICEYGRISNCIYIIIRSFSLLLISPNSFLVSKFYIVILGRSVTYTNWGITSTGLEPATADKCVKMCANKDGCGGGEKEFGTWKTVPCDTSLKYICEVPCKKNSKSFIK